jgi:hypothetical protein
MPIAKCTPGQGGVPAFPNAPVVLEPVTGDFGNQPGAVRLYSNNISGSAPMTVDGWEPQRIRARIPGTNPGDGEQGETFKVVIDANGGYESNPVDVLGPTGGYPLPPTHLTATCTPGQGGVAATPNEPIVLEPVTGDFGSQPGGVRLYSNNASGYSDLTIMDWKPERITALIPETNPGSGVEDETFRVVIEVKETFESDKVDVLGPTGGYPLLRTHATPAREPNMKEASDKKRD